MDNELEPLVDQWYYRCDLDQPFYVTAVDGAAQTIEVLHADGGVEQYSFAQWRELDLELAELPESWSGPWEEAELADKLAGELAEDDWRLGWQEEES